MEFCGWAILLRSPEKIRIMTNLVQSQKSTEMNPGLFQEPQCGSFLSYLNDTSAHAYRYVKIKHAIFF